jgi:DnaK suppressor protein
MQSTFSLASRQDHDHPAPAYEAYRTTLLTALADAEAEAVASSTTAEDLAGLSDAGALLSRELASSGERIALETIAEIEHALARLDDGTYGSCEQCGQMIPLERLEVIPHTRHCVNCPLPAPLRRS